MKRSEGYESDIITVKIGGGTPILGNKSAMGYSGHRQRADKSGVIGNDRVRPRVPKG